MRDINSLILSFQNRMLCPLPSRSLLRQISSYLEGIEKIEIIRNLASVAVNRGPYLLAWDRTLIRHCCSEFMLCFFQWVWRMQIQLKK